MICSEYTHNNRFSFKTKINVFIIASLFIIGAFLFLIGSPYLHGLTRKNNLGFSYVFFIDGSKIYAMNGVTGKIECSDKNTSKVIQNVLDNMPSNEGILLFKAGNYTLSSDIIVSKSCIIQGEGDWSGGTKFVKSSGTAFIISVGYVTLRDLYIDGSKREANGVSINDEEYITIENVWFNNCSKGITLNGSIWGHKYKELHFEHNDIGINCTSGVTDFQAYMERIWIYEPLKNGVILRNLNGCTFINLEVMGSGQPSIKVIGYYGGRSVFIDCIGDYAGKEALYIEDGVWMEFDDCFFNNRENLGLSVPVVYINNTGVTIGNYIQFLGGFFYSRNGSGHVFELEKCTEIKIFDAIIRSETQILDNRAGIYLSNSFRCEIKDCTFYGGKYGIQESSSGENWLHPNVYDHSVDTPVTGIAITSRLGTIQVPFTRGTENHASGWLVDQNGEYAGTWFVVPEGVHQVVRLNVYAMSDVTEEDAMLAEYVIRFGSENEGHATHDVYKANMSSSTVDFYKNDMIVWRLTFSSLVFNLSSGDCVEVEVKYEEAVTPNYSTGCYFRLIVIDYV